MGCCAAMHGCLLAQRCSAASTAKPSCACTWLGYMWEKPQLPICCISTLSPNPIQHQPPPSQVPANAGPVCSHFPTCVWIVHFSTQFGSVSTLHPSALCKVLGICSWQLLCHHPGLRPAMLCWCSHPGCAVLSPPLPAVSLLWGSCPSHSGVAEHPAAIYTIPLKVSGQL